MDQSKHSISPNELYARLGTDAAPIIVDVRRETDFAGADTLVADAIEQPGVEATEDRFPLAISKTAPLKNVEVSLRLETTGGTSDRDGGFALRLRTPNNYYLVKLDALRDRVLFLLVADGVPEEIVGVDADIAPHTWRTLAVRASDDQFVVSLDGTWVFTGFDRTHRSRAASHFGPRATASRASTRSRSHRCHESAMTQSSAAFTFRGLST
jgi:hypothetical protein